MVLLLIAVTLYLLFYRTPLFWRPIQSSINSRLALQSDLILSATVSGSLASGNLNLTAMTLQRSDSTKVIRADSLVFRGTLESMLGTNKQLDAVHLSGYSVNTRELESLLQASDSESRNNIVVDRITAEMGSILLPVDSGGADTLMISRLNGSGWFIDGYGNLNIQSSNCRIPGFLPTDLEVSGGFNFTETGETELDELILSSSFGKLTVSIQTRADTLQGRLQADSIRIHEFLRLEEQNLLTEAMLDGQYDFQMQIPGHVTATGNGLLTINGQGMGLHLDQAILDSTNLSLIARIGDGQQSWVIDLQSELESLRSRLSLNIRNGNFIKVIPEAPLKIEGLYARVDFLGDPEKFTSTLIADSATVNSIPLTASRISTSFNDGSLTVKEMQLTQHNNELGVHGQVFPALDLKGSLRIEDADGLPLWIDRTAVSGLLTTDFSITGDHTEPQVDGELITRSFGWGQHLNLSGSGKYSLAGGFSDAGMDFVWQGNSGVVFRDSVQAFSISAYRRGEEFRLEEFHVQGTQNLFSTEFVSGDTLFSIPKLVLIVGEDRLSLSDTLNIDLRERGKYLFEPTILMFDRAGIALDGVWTAEMGLNLKLDYEMLDLGKLIRFTRMKLPHYGMATGTTEMTGSLKQPVFTNTLSLTDAHIVGYDADSARGTLIVGAREIRALRIDAYKDGGHATVQGLLPSGYALKGMEWQDQPQNFSVLLEDFDLHDLRFRNIVGQAIGGRTTGKITFRGKPLQTKLDGQLEISSGQFDTLRFSHGHAVFEYADDLITFDSIYVQAPWGYGGGSGYLPTTLDIAPVERPFLKDSPVGFDFSGEFSDLKFLSSNLSPIDEIVGDYTVDLRISGPLGSPMRNGKLRGHNSTIRLAIIGNPVVDVHTEMTMVDNQLTIDHFSGRMPFLERSEIGSAGVVDRATGIIGSLLGVNTTAEYKGEVLARGSADFTSFFRPRFDVTVTGTEVYYRSTDGEVEAITDAQLSYVGQDTMDVNGILPVIQAGYFANFTSDPLYEESIVDEEGTSLFRYSLNTEIPGNLLIDNDQLQAEFEGEMWLLDYGDGTLRFSGTLQALPGGKFFYLGNELRILEGELVFNPVEFNPTIHMVAGIDISGEEIELTLTGDLIEPQLLLPQNTTLNQSDILAYLTINQKLVEEGFDATRIINPVQSYVGILVEKQLERYGKQLIGLDIIDLKMEGSSNLFETFGDSTETSLLLGQRISKNLKVTYEGDLRSLESGTDYDFGLEYKVNRNFSITSKINQDGLFQLRGRLKYSY